MSLAQPPQKAPPSSGGPPASLPITVEMYRRMIEAGILGERDRVILWDGRLVPRMSVKRPHSASVTKTSNRLYDLHVDGYFVEAEQPMAFRFAPSAPQPDVKVVRGHLENFPVDFPTTADVALVVEVSDSSLAFDRALASDYAAEEIPIYWIVNIPGRRLETFAEPIAGVYTVAAVFGPEEIVPVILDGREVGRVRVSDLLL